MLVAPVRLHSPEKYMLAINTEPTTGSLKEKVNQNYSKTVTFQLALVAAANHCMNCTQTVTNGAIG